MTLILSLSHTHTHKIMFSMILSIDRRHFQPPYFFFQTHIPTESETMTMSCNITDQYRDDNFDEYKDNDTKD